MNANFDIETIRKELPHGTIGRISKETGIDRNSISRTLHGDTKSPNYPEIIKAIAKHYTDFKARKEEALKALSNALSPESLEQKEAVK